MSAKERVLRYFADHVDKDANPKNGLSIKCMSSNIWIIELGSPKVVGFSFMETDSEDVFEIAARMLKLDNPWRLTSEELPEKGKWILSQWSRGHCGTVLYRGTWWDDKDVGKFVRLVPYRWMYVPE